MSIYRGAGGAGDAVADSASEALLIRELAIEVQADADATAASATAASNSASASATSASSAATSATNASNSATSASTSATNAASSATAAQTAENNAEAAETNAEASQSAAETAETNAETAASNASASASTATTQATNASNSASSASTSATNAASSASSASTSATNASNSATSASGSASGAASSASSASTSASNAATSATSASNSATTATTQAGIATTQANNAASSASAASTSATNASNSASSASTSASTATTQATNAANSASSSATSADSAAASAAAAAMSYDSFDDRYLGSKSAAPTLDNDGNALVTGALYYNNGTVTPADKGMFVYDGTGWIAASAASTAILTVFKYTATAGQTTFTGADDNALTLTYTAGSALVTVNGAIIEIGTDVTATTGTSIVLAQAALVNDEVNIYAFATFNIANTYTQAEVNNALALKLNAANPSYTGTLTGGTGVVNLGSGQFYKDASGNVGIGTNAFNYATSGRGLIELSGSSASLIGLKVGATPYGYIVANSSVTELAAVGASQPLLLTTNATERMRIDSSGNVIIGGTSSASGTTRLSLRGLSNSVNGIGTVNSSDTGTIFSFFIRNASDTLIGSITNNGIATLFNTTSDYRLKTVIAPVSDSGTRLDALQPIEYDWNTGGRTRGFLAHQFAEVYPSSVSGEKDAVDKDGKPVYQGMQASTPEVMADLIAEIQSLRKRVAQLESK